MLARASLEALKMYVSIPLRFAQDMADGDAAHGDEWTQLPAERVPEYLRSSHAVGEYKEFDAKCRVFSMREGDPDGDWKALGSGNAYILRRSDSGIARVLVRSKRGGALASFLIEPHQRVVRAPIRCISAPPLREACGRHARGRGGWTCGGRSGVVRSRVVDVCRSPTGTKGKATALV